MKQALLKIYWILSSQFGIDLRKCIRALFTMPRFIVDLCRFRKGYRGVLKWKPCLHDRFEEGGITKSEYFWQDLVVARLIHEAAPEKHVDIGSRVDGFVAHIAAFREVEVFDIRPVTANIPGVIFKKADLMDTNFWPGGLHSAGYCDSLSCLHALEHFGLGRYGDPITPFGYQLGLANMAKILRPFGILYLSTPIGQERVEFNANWVFDPRTIIDSARSIDLSLKSLTVFTQKSGIQEIELHEDVINRLAGEKYSLGIFTFEKI